MKQYTKRCKML